jgi:hypothetical protein
MKKLEVLFSLLIFAQSQGIAQTTAVGFSLGHNGGPGVKIHGLISDFAQGFPLSAKVTIGYTSVNPGNAADARRIFINDATNGTPEQSGRTWDFRGDFLYKMKWFSPARTYIYAGVRYVSFLGNFKFIGGNEDFDVTSNQWGIGTGLEMYFPISARMDLVSTAGIDYFIASELQGHDTTYSPDGENINIQHDYTYTDADRAINQPTVEFLIMIGLNYHLGR